MGVGIIKGDFMVCLEWMATIENNIPTNLEIGIRKAIGSRVSKENMTLLTGKELSEDSLNPWWYLDENISSLDISFIKDKIDAYLKKINAI